MMFVFFRNFKVRNNLIAKVMSNRTGDTFIALLIGAAIGVGVGILFAPDKGATTRQKIKETFDESGDDVIEKFNDIVSKIQNKAADTKISFEETLEDLVSEGSYKTEELITLLEQKLKALKEENAKYQK
ncbi:MAG: hypothetical protein C0512_01200 [Flavobacterium sp.]|nr:hypothetical protein [Flavobacterium sp.]